MSALCRYCGNYAELVGGDVIYPHRPDLKPKNFWQCEPCGAFVGCHSGTTTPLGTLANGTLRELRKQAHHAFDPIWRSGEMSRSAAYRWLTKALDRRTQVHIGASGPRTCARIIDLCLERRRA